MVTIISRRDQNRRRQLVECAGGKFNLCYSAWKNGCHSTEAWQFGWESGIQIFNRWYRRSAAAILCEP